MYEFVRGPLLWVSFIVFFLGMIWKVLALISLSRQRDKVVYNHFDLGWALRSIFHWLLPLNHTVRQYPFHSFATYAFHFFLLIVPIFLTAHNVLWHESWRISLWSLPEVIADVLTMVVIAIGIYLCVRRMVAPQVRIVTTASDYLLLLVTVLPFITGTICYHQWLDYETMLIIHILSGELMLIAIPFTRLSHMALFFLSRAHIGMEFGSRRGTVTW